MVARVRGVEKPGCVLSRASAYCARGRCVMGVELFSKIDLTAFLSSAFGMKGLCHVQECLEPPYQPQSLLGVGFFANASAALSLAVNVHATMLRGYKAWCVDALHCLT